MNEAQRARQFAEQAAHFALKHNVRTINCTPRTAELIEMLQAAYAAGAADENEACLDIAKSMVSPIDITEAIRARQEQEKEKP